MNITLSPEQEQFIQSQIERGIFATPEQAIAAALNLLERQNLDYEQWVTEARKKVDVGLKQLARGEKVPLESALSHLEQKLAQYQKGEM